MARYTVIALTALLLCFSVRAEQAFSYISVGKMIFNGDSTVGAIGWSQNNWDAELGMIGGGETDRGEQHRTVKISFSKRIYTGWSRTYGRLGAGVIGDSPLVGAVNYVLGAGCDIGNWFVEYRHDSSAGINRGHNTGLDVIGFGYRF